MMFSTEIAISAMKIAATRAAKDSIST
jgi:hypothetical protein